MDVSIFVTSVAYPGTPASERTICSACLNSSVSGTTPSSPAFTTAIFTKSSVQSDFPATRMVFSPACSFTLLKVTTNSMQWLPLLVPSAIRLLFTVAASATYSSSAAACTATCVISSWLSTASSATYASASAVSSTSAACVSASCASSSFCTSAAGCSSCTTLCAVVLPAVTPSATSLLFVPSSVIRTFTV